MATGKRQVKKRKTAHSSEGDVFSGVVEKAFVTTDSEIIEILRDVRVPIARFGLFFVFFYFGILKVIGLSPANPLVEELLGRTLPFLEFSQFIGLFGAFEMLIGLLFILPGMERLAIGLLFPHMAATILPLILLPEVAWQGFFVPTIEGQYILKNIIIIALAVAIGADLAPYSPKHRSKRQKK